MQNYVVELESPVFESFRCQKAANSLDIDTTKKSRHRLAVSADVQTPFNVGLIVGSSGSGKTTLAHEIFGLVDEIQIDSKRAIIDQFPESMSYDECAEALSGMGLTSVPCWVRAASTLSNGQRARAEAALLMAHQSCLDDFVVIDEWTSVVDRTVAKVMSACIAKHARRSKRKIVLLSCHYDVIEWLNPDFVIDCNRAEYTDRRSMVGAHERSDRLRFDVREVDRRTWPFFSKYHYLSDTLPGGRIFTFGLFHGSDQIGFGCYAAYIIGDHTTFFSNRVVIHPDYVGLGLVVRFVNETAKEMVRRGYRVKAKFSSVPMYRARMKDPLWRCTKIDRPIKKLAVGRISDDAATNRNRQDKMRHKITTYHFDFTWRTTHESQEKNEAAGILC